jgi:phosphoglycolate phosphatase-like HAD superfamily hydrolase
MLWQWAINKTQVFILDLDGTLMPSAEIDNQCFWQAVFECYDLHGALPDLHGFKYVTDTGILREWCIRKLDRSATSEETRQIRQRFSQLLQNASSRHPGYFSPLAGVEDWLQAVQDNPHVFAAIATGGWEHSARLKLSVSGLDRFELPLASSDDADARTKIMQIAARQVRELHAVEGAVISCVGDGTWDLQASRLLNWTFIGIASGVQAERLRKAGAGYVQADFTRPETE